MIDDDHQHGWARASEAYQCHRNALNGTVATLIEMSNLPVHSVWIDLKETLGRAASELAAANAETARLRDRCERLEERVKSLEAHEA